MSNIGADLLAAILATAGSIAFTLHLVYAKVKGSPVMYKQRFGMPNPALFQKIYSDRFLIISMIITSLFILRVGYEIFRSVVGRPPFFLVIASFIVQLIISLTVLYTILFLLRRKD